MKKLYLCGIYGTGKGLLRTLLDGHPNILNCPFQGFGLSLFTKCFRDILNRKKGKNKDDGNRPHSIVN